MRLLQAVVPCLLTLLTATDAAYATVHKARIDSPQILNFWEVPLGTSKTIQFEYEFYPGGGSTCGSDYCTFWQPTSLDPFDPPVASGPGLSASFLTCDPAGTWLCPVLLTFTPLTLGEIVGSVNFGFNVRYNCFTISNSQIEECPPTVEPVGHSTIVYGTGVDAASVPIPAALPLLASGLGALGFIGWRRKRKLEQKTA